ncbi:DNA sulfur modification protein DndD [Eubacterium sp. AM05-23]|uniref:DNA sulfur modification protein DndD n=1 Tax=Eubacterium TaxID=1730 RepID=UPI000E4B3B00|nr:MULTISPECIES: DNA sulfur modification protein DndD [Eubacterium]RHO56674.1 DNA sulfur modification protein DndD [Eubacterium sp. AM05-23]
MIIRRLRLHNFGVYAGDNEFLFTNNKPIVLVGGMNGRGKTTFLEAVLLALYGSNSVAYTESKKRSYSQYLKSFVNKNAEDKKCIVELEFEINNGTIENYLVKRTWNSLDKKTDESIFVYKDGVANEFLTQNWPMFVENILPSALSSFFFFDGEKIAEMAVDSSNNQLKNAIRSMLGITVLDVLGNDILRNIKKINKDDLNDKSSEMVQKLRDEKDQAIAELEEIDAEIESLTHVLAEDNDKLEALHQLYNAKGGDAVEKKQETTQRRALLKSELLSEENHLREIASNELPLVLVSDLLQNIKLQATDEHNDTIMREAVLQLDDILDEFANEYHGDTKASFDFVEYVKTRQKNSQDEPFYSLSDQALFQVNNLVEGLLNSSKTEAKRILAENKKKQKQIGELDSYLSLDINEKELKEVYKRIKKAEEKLIKDQVKMSALEQKRSAANSKAMTATSEFNKYVESYLATAESRDSAERTIKYSNIALSILDRYQVELQKRKTDILAETITSCYKKLANKKNLIDKIVMEADSLAIKYLSEEGKEVTQDSLSAGEQQLMVISILWALAICSKKKLPVIIDTPLSRLDSLHRTALINTYFPNAGEQTIILSTDSEIDSTYYGLMKENVGDEFTLKYDEKTKSTSIERGYLIGA